MVFVKSRLYVMGLTIFWTEGNQSQKGKGGKRIEVVNSNPAIIKIFLDFFRKFFNIEENRLRGRVQVHNKNEIKKSEFFWSKLTKIPRKQFLKPLIKVNKNQKTSTNILPYGTFTVTYNDTELFRKLTKNIQKIISKYN